MSFAKTMTQVCKHLEKDDGIGNKFQLTETVAWMLFLKCVDGEEKELAEQAEMVGEEYSPVVSGKYRWDHWAGPKSDLSGDELLEFVSQDLFAALGQLEGEGNLAEVTRNIFRHAALYPKSGYRARDCLETLNRGFDQENFDRKEIRSEFDNLLRQMTINSKEHPRLFTPRPLCSLLAKLLNPKIGQKITDPACGTAGILIAAHSLMLSQAKTPKKLETLKEKTFYGREKRDLQYILGVIHCYFHGIALPNLERGNTLSINLAQIAEEDKYDIIFCNPTFDSDEGSMVQNNFPIATGEVELMFLQHIEKLLRRGGRAAVILPEGVFFKTGAAHIAVKKKLFENANVRAVISLPQVGVKTSILIFDKTGATKNVWMYKFIVPGGVKITQKSGYKMEYFDDLLKKYSMREESDHSKIVEKSEIVEKDYNISVSAYIETAGEEPELSAPKEYLGRIDDLLDQSKENIKKLKKQLEDSPCKKAN